MLFRSCLRGRWARPLIAFIAASSLLAGYVYLSVRPSYTLYKSLERLDPEHSHSVIKPSQKYVRFKQLQGAGFNNQAQEILLFHHLALSSGRTYAYQPLIWRPRGEHATVPLSAFLGGVTRNSISSAVFDEICPESEVKHVKLWDTYETLWTKTINALRGPERCIVVDDWIMYWGFLASDALHDIWPGFKDYLREHFQWSRFITEIADRAQSQLHLRSHTSQSEGEPYTALHLRRGDFEEHCHVLAKEHTGFTTWATLPELRSRVAHPPLDTENATSVVEHCYPSLRRILSVIDEHAKAHPHIRALHMLHDGAWDHPTVYIQVQKLAVALMDASRALAAGWTNGPMKIITHSGMLPVRLGEADWAVTVDVEIARRADFFVGNGFSSLSTQIIALRLGADNGRPEDIVFY
ncbi:hypothetical protein BDN72DRAFT_834066 [Pluteus cervinus]|uniref:Uncharacterized protein n=1 Tax=Pluteus cervinus TaxID=181527 RepID=A0ACD3B8U3_9AGAR|nr:hypothetical protein BDN72DRAFT_834066 [Pluteus cervinus]